MLDDVLGIIVLAVVASLAKTGEIEVLNVVYLIAGGQPFFLVGAIFFRTIAQPLLCRPG